jgi:hypothetical protein
MKTNPYNGIPNAKACAALPKTAYRYVLLLISVLFTAAIVSACGGSGAGGVTTRFENRTATEPTRRTFQGVASTSVRFTDQLGQTRIRNYATPIVIDIAPPLRSAASGQVEINPFHFSVSPVSGIAEEGLYTLVSAAVIFQGSERLIQFWRFIENGDTFSGELTQPDNPLSATGNLIYLPSDLSGGFPVPIAFEMARETRLTGMMTKDHISFRIEGDTTDRTHSFVSEVSATRAR